VDAAEVVAAPPDDAHAASPQLVLERAARAVEEAERDEHDIEAALPAQRLQPPRHVGVAGAERSRALRRRLVDPAGAVVAPREGAANVHEPRPGRQRVIGEPAGPRGLAAPVGGEAAVGQAPSRHRSGAVDDRVDRLTRGQEAMARGVQLADDCGLQEARSTGDMDPAEPQIVHPDRRYGRRHNGSVSGGITAASASEGDPRGGLLH
jgi:hypothetical protein